MNREDVHQAILEAFLGLVASGKAGQVRIISRLYNDEHLGGDSVVPTFVFVPDLHLMSRDGDDAYQFGFRRINGVRRVERGVLLTALFDTLVAIRDRLDNELGDNSMKIIQLGDFVDLWREDEREHEGLEALVDRVITDNRDTYAKLVRVGALRADLVVGNHDQRGPESASLRRARMALPYKIGAKRTLLATHGHLFDPLEQLPDKIQEWFVERFGPFKAALTYLIDRTAGGQTTEVGGSEGAAPRVLHSANDGLGLPDWVNLWFTIAPRDAGRLTESHGLLPDALNFAEKVRQGGVRERASAGLGSTMPDLRTIVIGHSHFPRICVHRDVNNSDRNLVLMDCGAWIENSQFGTNDCVPSCHLGVLSGGDARIYQIDPHSSLFGPW